MTDYDLIVIGGGPGGYEAALEAAGCGMKTALIEKREIGGTCLNRGCIPVKTLLHASGLYQEMKTCGSSGLRAEGISFDIGAIHDRKDEVVGTLKSGVETLLKKSGVDILSGTGAVPAEGRVRFTSAEGEEKELTAENILIATGSVPFVPPIPGADLPGVMTSDGMLELRSRAPERLLIIGGGVIGMEFASFYAALGSAVTVVEAMPSILPNMDREISQSLRMLMKKRGVGIRCGCRVERIDRLENGRLLCYFTEKEETVSEEADAVLVSVGRRPNTDGLFPGAFAPAMERGAITADDCGRTDAPGLYAVGDVTGGVMLAHAATAQGRNAVAVMCGKTPHYDLSVIPGCVYTSPEIASAGMTADEAKRAGVEAYSVKYPMGGNGRTLIAGGERGYIRLVCEKGTGRVLGAQMMCERATDLIPEAVQAIAGGRTVSELLRAVYPHPTFSEGFGEALLLARNDPGSGMGR